MTLKILNKHILSAIKKLQFFIFTIPIIYRRTEQVWQPNISLFFYIGVLFYKAESGAWIRCGLSTSNRENSLNRIFNLDIPHVSYYTNVSY